MRSIFTKLKVRGIRITGMLLAIAVAGSALLGGGHAFATTGLSISGNQLYKDGSAYIPRGFNMIAVLTPSWCTNTLGNNANANWGSSELTAAANWHATMLRFQVSQRGLADSTISSTDRANYLTEVENAVTDARTAGFDVILSMQDQSIGCGTAHPFPTSMTTDAWNVLAPVYASDPYVMFELFNEPNETNNTAGWNQWKNGGTTPNSNQGDTAVGHQALLNTIRGLGNTNVVIADGLNMAERLSGLTTLSDSASALMYGIHPYFYTSGQSWWDSQYGTPSASVPVIATEWNYESSGCSTSYQTMGPMILQYLHDKHIGVLGQAFDVPGTTVTSGWTWTPTDCTTANGGSGQDLLTYFTGLSTSDTTAPTAATGVSASLVSGPQVNLSWTAATDNVAVATYRVMRDGFFIALTTGTSYADTTMSTAHTHTYKIYAVDAAYNVSPISNGASVYVP